MEQRGRSKRQERERVMGEEGGWGISSPGSASSDCEGEGAGGGGTVDWQAAVAARASCAN